MLVEVQSVVINCAKMSSFDVEELKRCTLQSSNNGPSANQFSSAGASAIHRWSSLGGLSDSTRQSALPSSELMGGVSRFSQQEASEHVIANAFIQQLSTKELALYDKLAPHLQTGVICNKVLNELLWSCQVTETEWGRLLPKLPHLKIVKRDK